MSGPRVRFETSLGNFTVELFTTTPITSGNFLSLVKDGFYDGLHFHRVIAGFMNQFGCPNSKDANSPMCGTGGPAPNTKYTTLTGEQKTRDGRGKIPDEHVTKDSNQPGTISMANAGPNSGGSQFFINVKDNAYLDWFDQRTPSAHPVFGKVVEGMDIVTKINNAKTGAKDRPDPPIKVIKAVAL